MNPEKHYFRRAVHSQGKQVARSDSDEEPAVALFIQAGIPPVGHGEREIRIRPVLPGDLPTMGVSGERQGNAKFRCTIKRLRIVGKKQFDVPCSGSINMIAAC